MKQLVWDLPTRVFHWALTLAILSAYTFAHLGRGTSLIFSLHVVMGMVAGFLLVWRFVWGFAGSRHARWSALAFHPREIKDYFLSVLRRKGTYYTGHNPGSAVVIWIMFALIVLTLVSGVGMNFAGRNRTWRQVHEFAPSLLILFVVFHVVGTALATRMHREDYIIAMFSGLKRGQPEEAIAHAHPVAAVVMAAWVAFGTVVLRRRLRQDDRGLHTARHGHQGAGVRAAAPAQTTRPARPRHGPTGRDPGPPGRSRRRQVT